MFANPSPKKSDKGYTSKTQTVSDLRSGLAAYKAKQQTRSIPVMRGVKSKTALSDKPEPEKAPVVKPQAKTETSVVKPTVAQASETTSSPETLAKQLGSSNTHQVATQVPDPSLTPAPAQTPLQVVTQNTSATYYPDLPMPERVQKLVDSGCSNEQVSLRLGISLKAVMSIRRELGAKTIMADPRSMFASYLKDFDEAFQTAKTNYFDDPTSETNFRVMTDFARTMRELVTSYQDLEDPSVVVDAVVRKCLQPTILKILETVFNEIESTKKNLLPFLRESDKPILVDGLNNAMKSLQQRVNTDYNASLDVLGKIYGVDTTPLRTKA